MRTMTSPASSWASSAALPLVTLETRAPLSVNALSSETPSSGVRELPVAMSSSAMRLAELLGIENPRPMLPASPPTARVAMAELTPMS